MSIHRVRSEIPAVSIINSPVSSSTPYAGLAVVDELDRLQGERVARKVVVGPTKPYSVADVHAHRDDRGEDVDELQN